MTQALLQQAIEAIRSGDKAAGQRLLAQVLRADPRSETAWLWMSQIVDSDAQRLDCLRRILAINPNNATARRGIELLQARMSGASRSSVAPPPTQPAAPPTAAQPEPPAQKPASALFADAPTGQHLESSEAPPAVEAAAVVTPAPAIPIGEQETRPPARRRERRRPPERETVQRRSILPYVLGAIILLGGGAAVLAIASSQPAAPVATPAPVAGRVAVALDRDGQSRLALLRPDGSDLIELPAHGGAASDPAWSPDGRRIAFVAQDDGTSSVAIIDANGQAFIRLTPDDAHAADPAWSPDGARIAYASDETGDFDIYVLPTPASQPDGAIGFGPLNLTRFEGDDHAPAWTPDGAAIVFQSDREGQNDIYRMQADGSKLAQLTRDPAEDTEPAVSPDGERIAFVSTRGGDADIYVMSLDGSSPRAVTDNDAEDQAPSWTPDGAILFTSMLADGAAVFVVQPDGSGLSRVGGSLADVFSAAWQPVDVDPATLSARVVPTPTLAPPAFELPEGAIAFASNREGAFDFYRMNVDGTGLERIRSAPGDERHLSRSPVGNSIAFDMPISDTLHVVAADFLGAEASVITLTQDSVSAHTPAWSPDGTLIAYELDAEGGPDMAVIQPDGLAGVRLTDRPGYDGCLSWRPDARQIAFTSDRDGNLDIYIVNADGSGVKRLTQHPVADRCPAWSPDGRQIAFVSDRNGAGVYLMDADGANARLLVALRSASQPVWSSDGRFLLAASTQDGNRDIYLISLEQAAIWNLTATSGADEVDPVWLP